MFFTRVFYIEGNPEQLQIQIKDIMEEYRLKSKLSPIPDGVLGRTIYLSHDPQAEILDSRFTKAAIILFNTESNSMKMKGADTNRIKVTTISHEIYHVVSKLTKGHQIDDEETPAYLTGYLAGELLF